jgi:hypothetical protein
MIYSRAYLNLTKKSIEETQDVHQALIQAAYQGQELTMAEARYVGVILEASQAQTEDGIEIIQQLYEQLTDYKFWQIYMRYAHDVEGWAEIRSPRGPVPLFQKMLDAAYLEREYQSWKPIVEKTNHKHTSLQYLSKEARDEIKEALAWSRQLQEGSIRRAFVEKTVTLQTKFVYIKVAEYYQEYTVKQDTFEFCGRETVIDAYAYTHVLLRHFSPFSKFGRPGLTFHHDPDIDVENLPIAIKNILQQFEEYIGIAHFHPEKVYLNLNGRNYVIWYKQLPRNAKGGERIWFLRVQSFYPAELGIDLKAVNEMRKIQVTPKLAFFINAGKEMQDSKVAA